MPVPAKLFTDSFAKHFLNLLLKHIRLISVVQMIARMFVVLKFYVSIPNPQSSVINLLKIDNLNVQINKHGPRAEDGVYAGVCGY